MADGQHIRVVFDTDVLLQAAFNATGGARMALDLALDRHTLVASVVTLGELRRKLADRKFARYIDLSDAMLFYALIEAVSEIVSVTRAFAICDDPDDNKLFDLADEAGASFIVSNDRAVLAVKHFRRIQTVTVSDYLRIGRGG